MYINLFKSVSIKTLRKKFESLLFPYLCVLCCQLSDKERDLCSRCEADLPKLPNICQQCGNCLNTDSEQALICGNCLKHPPAYDFMIPLFEYIDPVDRLILRLKFKKKLLYARLLGELMAEAISEKYQNALLPECIIPVPLHPKRLRERGFNQSLELARPVAQKLGIPIEAFLYQRIKNTVQQSSIPIEERQKNVEHAFLGNHCQDYQRVAIIDDVVTTGLTVNALSRVLKFNGVIEVTVWCCARTCR